MNPSDSKTQGRSKNASSRGAMPAPFHELVLQFIKDLAHSVGRLAVRRVRRTRERVQLEYQGGHWARVLGEKRWQESGSLEAFLIPDDPGIRLARVDGQVVKISTRDYYRRRLALLPALVVQCAGDVDES